MSTLVIIEQEYTYRRPFSPGVGEAKLNRYGAAFLEVIRATV